MARQAGSARPIRAALLLGLLGGLAAPVHAATARSGGNMIVLRCNDDGSYDCKPPCDYRFCCE